MRKLTCNGECEGEETTHEYMGEDDDGYEIWQCSLCGQRSDYGPRATYGGSHAG